MDTGSDTSDVWARLVADSEASAVDVDDETSTSTSSSAHSDAVSLWRDLADAISAEPGA